MLRTTSIAFVTELFYPSIGGQEFRFLRLTQGLSKRGFNVAVYMTDHTGRTLPNPGHPRSLDHIRVFTPRSLKELLKIHGLKIFIGKGILCHEDRLHL